MELDYRRVRTKIQKSYCLEDQSYIYMYSVRVLQKGLDLVSAVHLVSEKDVPLLRSARGWGDKYPRMFLILG